MNQLHLCFFCYALLSIFMLSCNNIQSSGFLSDKSKQRFINLQEIVGLGKSTFYSVSKFNPEANANDKKYLKFEINLPNKKLNGDVKIQDVYEFMLERLAIYFKSQLGLNIILNKLKIKADSNNEFFALSFFGTIQNRLREWSNDLNNLRVIALKDGILTDQYVFQLYDNYARVGLILGPYSLGSGGTVLDPARTYSFGGYQNFYFHRPLFKTVNLLYDQNELRLKINKQLLVDASDDQYIDNEQWRTLKTLYEDLSDDDRKEFSIFITMNILIGKEKDVEKSYLRLNNMFNLLERIDNVSGSHPKRVLDDKDSYHLSNIDCGVEITNLPQVIGTYKQSGNNKAAKYLSQLTDNLLTGFMEKSSESLSNLLFNAVNMPSQDKSDFFVSQPPIITIDEYNINAVPAKVNRSIVCNSKHEYYMGDIFRKLSKVKKIEKSNDQGKKIYVFEFGDESTLFYLRTKDFDENNDYNFVDYLNYNQIEKNNIPNIKKLMMFYGYIELKFIYDIHKNTIVLSGSKQIKISELKDLDDFIDKTFINKNKYTTGDDELKYLFNFKVEFRPKLI